MTDKRNGIDRKQQPNLPSYQALSLKNRALIET